MFFNCIHRCDTIRFEIDGYYFFVCDIDFNIKYINLTKISLSETSSKVRGGHDFTSGDFPPFTKWTPMFTYFVLKGIKLRKMPFRSPKLEDNTCPICLYIFIQPVTMPCGHELCLECFKQNVEEANFCCPLCRIRISTWARRAARNKTLVNEKRWKFIQEHFTEQVQNRLDGKEEDDAELQGKQTTGCHPL